MRGGKQRPSSSRCLASSVADGEASQGYQVLVESLTSRDTTIAQNAVQLTQKLKTFRFSFRPLMLSNMYSALESVQDTAFL